ncbi:hypothetical protein R6Q57_029839 [Mikania cordata]
MSLVFEKSCKQFPLETIQKATDYFNESNFLGKGSFGRVYKGVVVDGSTTTLVAIKRLNPESKQGVAEFETEIKMLSKCKHCHLVNLLGYCNDHQEMILVYEYMSHGTLANHLYKNQDSSLTWVQRLKICIGAARGLDYLHTGTGLSDRIIHLDVKSENILLDENWAAKIADLGLSKIGPANQDYSEVITEHVRGTRGYIDPQYVKYRKFSRKADVYAFGVVLLEVLTGTRALGGEIIPYQGFIDLANWIQQHMSNTTLVQIIDRKVASQIKPECLKYFANTASKSLHNDPKKRPSMSEVVSQLEVALACQQQTNPSTSMIEDDVLQHFNAVSSHKHLATGLDNMLSDIEGSSNPSTDDSEDSTIWSIMGISMAEYLGKAHNIFGDPITNKTMVQRGLTPTQANKAQLAYTMMNHGETLTYATSRNWFGDIGPSPYPKIILNGQWGAYLHTKIPKMPSGSVAAVVYRGKYKENAFCDRMITWSIPWQRFTQDNAGYCEINKVEHFESDAVWDEIYKRTPYAGRESSANWKDCYTRVTVESDTSPIYKAVFTHVNAVVTSVDV